MANASVLTARSSPRTRSAPMPRSTATRQATTAPISTVHGNATGRSVPSSTRSPRQPMSTDKPRAKRGRGERGDPAERHLAERELPAPPGEHDDGDRAYREADDDRPHLVARREVRRQRCDHRDDERSETQELREAPHPPDAPHPFGHRVGARRELEALTAGLLTAADPCHQDDHEHQEQELHEPRLARGSGTTAPARRRR